jgi:hypothetical protein
MSKQSDPLRTTAPELHRFYVRLTNDRQWYAVMSECRAWFGKNWRCQNKIRKKLRSGRAIGPRTGHVIKITAWFEVPDLGVCTWIATKHSLEITAQAPEPSNK